MASSEDAATVLEVFLQDVSNLPAEISHLLEEVQAKDKTLQEYWKAIAARDGSIQRFIQANGSHAPNPKEEAYSKAILQHFEKAQILQEEKTLLSEKAAILLDRHIRRLDLKIRDLQTEGLMPTDSTIPSLLNASLKPTNPPLLMNGPLQPLQQNNLSVQTTVPNGSRLSQSTLISRTGNLGFSAPALNSTISSHLNSSVTSQQTSLRESSTGPSSLKRARLTGGLGTLPSAASALARGGSQGPGTPKPGTPTLTASGATRSGSLVPKSSSTAYKKKLAPHQQIRRRALKKAQHKSRKGGGTSTSPTPSDSETGTNDDDEEMTTPPEHGDADEEDGADGDDKKYCTCQRVSHGDMVACDNTSCAYEWFHWGCVGLTKEPVGSWYCPECRANMKGAAATAA